MKSMSTQYTNAFWNAMRGDISYNPAMDEGKTSDGAYALPPYGEELLAGELCKHNIFRQIASIVHTKNPDGTIKALAPAGMASFIQEGEPIPESDAAQTALDVRSHKIAKILKISSSCVKDAGFDLPAALAAELGRSFGKTEERACVDGDGQNEPYGILHPEQGAGTGVRVSAEAGVSFDDISGLYFSLDAEYRRGGSWLMSDETAFSLRKVKDSSGNPLWRHNDDTIFGRPVYTSPYMPGIEAGSKPILFGDFSFYWFVERGGAAVLAMTEIYSMAGLIGYRASERVDGRLVRRDAVKALEMGV